MRRRKLKKKTGKRKTNWWCPACKSKYTTKREAMKCAKTPLLFPVFKVGERVSVQCPMFCEKIAHSAIDAFYAPNGKIVGIIGPHCPEVKTFDYPCICARAHPKDAHFYLFLITHKCPHCKKPESILWSEKFLKK